MPHLDALNEKYRAAGLRVIVVDASSRKELSQKMISEVAYKAPVLLDEKDVSSEHYKIVGTPTTYLVDQAGRMVFKHVGYGPGTEKVFEKEIEALLARKST